MPLGEETKVGVSVLFITSRPNPRMSPKWSQQFGIIWNLEDGDDLECLEDNYEKIAWGRLSERLRGAPGHYTAQSKYLSCDIFAFTFFFNFFVYFPTTLVSSCGKFTSLGLDSIDMIQPDTVCGTPAWYLSSTMARQLLCGISIFKSKATGVVASAQMVWSLVMWRARVNMQRAMHYSPTEHRSHPHFLHPPNTRSPNNSRYHLKKRYYLAC